MRSTQIMEYQMRKMQENAWAAGLRESLNGGSGDINVSFGSDKNGQYIMVLD